MFNQASSILIKSSPKISNKAKKDKIADAEASHYYLIPLTWMFHSKIILSHLQIALKSKFKEKALAGAPRRLKFMIPMRHSPI